MSIAPALVLREGDRDRLAELARLPSVPSGLAKRARMVLLAADGMANAQIARAAGVSRPTVIGWRGRYEQGGIKALEDEPARAARRRSTRSGSWSRRWRMRAARRAGWGSRTGRPGSSPPSCSISFATVARIWRKWGIQPHRIETFKFSADPQLEAKIRDVAGLYLNPPENAVVVSVDEKSQIQALDRTAPMLPVMPGLAARRTHDYQRQRHHHLFAALEVATGKITADACYPRHRHQEFLRFLKKVAAAHPASSCTSCWTTTAPTSTPRSASGWRSRRTSGSPCTSPRPGAPG